MMPNPVHIAYGGAALAAAAVVMLFLVVFFGDLFLKSEQVLRRWMEAFTWCVVGGLFATATVVAWIAAQFHR